MAVVSNMSYRDVDQIQKYEHEDAACAKRVFVVGGDFKLDVDPSKITDAVKEGLKSIEIKTTGSNMQQTVQTIEVPVVVKEVQIVQVKETVPVIQQEIKIVEVEKPIVQEKVVTVEKPIFIPGETKVVTVEIPTTVIVEKVVEKISIKAISIMVLEAAIIAFLILK